MSTFYRCDRCNQELSGQPFATIEPRKYYELNQAGKNLIIPKLYDLCEPCWEEVTNLIDEYRGNDG